MDIVIVVVIVDDDDDVDVVNDAAAVETPNDGSIRWMFSRRMTQARAHGNRAPTERRGRQGKYIVDTQHTQDKSRVENRKITVFLSFEK